MPRIVSRFGVNVAGALARYAMPGKGKRAPIPLDAACAVLKVDQDYTRETVIAALRREAKKAHPDMRAPRENAAPSDLWELGFTGYTISRPGVPGIAQADPTIPPGRIRRSRESYALPRRIGPLLLCRLHDAELREVLMRDFLGRQRLGNDTDHLSTAGKASIR